MPELAATRRAASPRGVPAATRRSTSARAAASASAGGGGRGTVRGPAGFVVARPLADHEHEFTAWRDAPGGRGGRELAERAPDDGLVAFGELPADRPGAARAAHGREVLQGGPDASGRLVDQRTSRVGADPGEPFAPLASRARQEPLERPARTGDPGRRDRGQHGRGSGHRHDAPTGVRPGRDHLRTRVADGGGTGIGHDREVVAITEVLEQRGDASIRTVRVQARHARLDRVAGEQPARDARVLRRDQRHGAQHLQRTEGDVTEVADRRRDDIQRAGARPAGRRRVAHPLAEPGRRRG